MRKFAGWLAVVVLAGCSGPQAVRSVSTDPDPEETAVEETDPEPTKRAPNADPFLDKLDRFEAAYAELTCKANPDVDPTSPVATLRCPYERLEQLVGEPSLTLEVYLRILVRHGFPTAEDYFKAKEYIAKARPGWFEGLKNRLMDFVEECGD